MLTYHCATGLVHTSKTVKDASCWKDYICGIINKDLGNLRGRPSGIGISQLSFLGPQAALPPAGLLLLPAEWPTADGDPDSGARWLGPVADPLRDEPPGVPARTPRSSVRRPHLAPRRAGSWTLTGSRRPPEGVTPIGACGAAAAMRSGRETIRDSRMLRAGRTASAPCFPMRQRGHPTTSASARCLCGRPSRVLSLTSSVERTAWRVSC